MDKNRESKIDLSDLNLEDMLKPDDWVERKIIEVAGWVVDYVLKDEGKWGFSYDFQTVWDASHDPLDLRIDFPVLDEDGSVYTEANLRDFVYWDVLEDTNAYDNRFKAIASALRSLADEIDNRLISRA